MYAWCVQYDFSTCAAAVQCGSFVPKQPLGVTLCTPGSPSHPFQMYCVFGTIKSNTQETYAGVAARGCWELLGAAGRCLGAAEGC